MEKELNRFAEELANKFSNLNKWFENKGIDPYNARVEFVDKDNKEQLSLCRGRLEICWGEYSVSLENVTKDHVLNLTGWELLRLRTVVCVNVYTNRNEKGWISSKNPFKLPF